ncbi:MAG: hypothetical protein Q8K65_00235 [Alphaproteobacteria bacterium]|nr:hypothetical protein [Alphaproteobacteria bacterium]
MNEITAAKDDTAAPVDHPAKPHKRLRTRALETGVGIAGFGNVLRAWRAEGNRLKNVAASLGKKFADMAAGTMVSMSFRVIAVTWVAGIIGGVSSLGMVALLAAATGVASATYNYAKNYAGEKLRGPKEQRRAAKIFDKKRLKKSGISFAAGFASGGVGLWLARTEIVQAALGWLRGVVFPSAPSAPAAAVAAAQALPPVSAAAPISPALSPVFSAAQISPTLAAGIPLPALRPTFPAFTL